MSAEIRTTVLVGTQLASFLQQGFSVISTRTSNPEDESPVTSLPSNSENNGGSGAVVSSSTTTTATITGTTKTYIPMTTATTTALEQYIQPTETSNNNQRDVSESTENKSPSGVGNSDSSTQDLSSTSNSRPQASLSTGTIIGVALSAAIVLSAIAFLIFFLYKRRKDQRRDNEKMDLTKKRMSFGDNSSIKSFTSFSISPLERYSAGWLTDEKDEFYKFLFRRSRNYQVDPPKIQQRGLGGGQSGLGITVGSLETSADNYVIPHPPQAALLGRNNSSRLEKMQMQQINKSARNERERATRLMELSRFDFELQPEKTNQKK